MSDAQRTTASGARSAWPSAAQFNEAIQSLRVTIGDEELRGGEAAVNALGLPMPYAGGFADIYKVRCPATGNTWAVKCFTRGATGLQQRYAEISRHLDQARLPFMVDFRYLDEGIRIDRAWYPIVKMRWIEGLNLNRFVDQALDQPAMLDQLLGLWVKLAGRLRGAGIAHADLQHGNVLLIQLPGSDKLGLRLIDYDGMYVPTLAGQRSGEVGHPAFQHPRRLREGTYCVEVDQFSHLAICCALRCLRLGGRALWKRFDNRDNLLFGERDFAAPEASPLFSELWQLGDPETQGLVGRLALATQRPLEETPWIETLVDNGRFRPLTSDERRAAQELLEPDWQLRTTVVNPPPETAVTTASPTPSDTVPPQETNDNPQGASSTVLLPSEPVLEPRTPADMTRNDGASRGGQTILHSRASAAVTAVWGILVFVTMHVRRLSRVLGEQCVMVLRWAARSCRSICGALVHIGGGLVRRTLPPVRFLLRNAWQALTALTGFYWYHRDALWQSFLDLLESSESSPQRQFEIRLTADREYKTARALDSAWEVELSDGCVYCGAPADGAITDERAVSDLTWPFWSIPVSFISGLAVGLFTWFLWALPLALVVGLVSGYLARGSKRVRLQFRRCEMHVDDARLPAARLFGDLLVIKVGCKEVRHQFLFANRSGAGETRVNE